MTLNKLLHLFRSQFPYLYNANGNSSFFLEFTWALNTIKQGKYLAQGLGYRELSVRKTAMARVVLVTPLQTNHPQPVCSCASPRGQPAPQEFVAT